MADVEPATIVACLLLNVCLVKRACQAMDHCKIRDHCKKDLLEWYFSRNEFPPLLILRRYLKLVIQYVNENNLGDCSVDNIKSVVSPFRLDLIPLDYPQPSDIRLW